LHAGWVAKKLSLTLPLSSKEIMDIAGPRKMASIAMIILTLAVGGVLYLASDEVQGYYQNSVNLDVAQGQLIEIDRLYREELRRKESMGIDINLINAALDVDKRIHSQRVDLLDVLKARNKIGYKNRVNAKFDKQFTHVLPIHEYVGESIMSFAEYILSFDFKYRKCME
jgi:hypothetical protein